MPPSDCCWLCSYQSEALGIKLNAFIVKHIGVMSIETIAMQVVRLGSALCDG